MRIQMAFRIRMQWRSVTSVYGVRRLPWPWAMAYASAQGSRGATVGVSLAVPVGLSFGLALAAPLTLRTLLISAQKLDIPWLHRWITPKTSNFFNLQTFLKDRPRSKKPTNRKQQHNTTTHTPKPPARTLLLERIAREPTRQRTHVLNECAALRAAVCVVCSNWGNGCRHGAFPRPALALTVCRQNPEMACPALPPREAPSAQYCPILPYIALYCPILPYIALYCPKLP